MRQERFKDDSPIVEECRKSYTLEERREKHSNAYMSWNDESDKVLCRMFDEGNTIDSLSEFFKRSKGTIISRLKKIGKIEEL
ncbi:hypothetical protein [Prevotella sp. HCN-7019]|uniref:hypothetical protein n=1 Tax=Prevotella sp. HCN-7019 TaxID=3134668 RepID=UPI0030C1324F